jgi:adenylate cyclase
MLVVIAGLGGSWFGYTWWVGSSRHEAAGRPAILVLPIRSDESQGRGPLLADGLTDELINGLTRFSTVRVFGRNTSDALVNVSGDLHAMRHRYGIGYLMRGAMHGAGDKLRLNVELVDAETGFARWADRYEEDIAKAFDTLDKVISTIVSNVAVKVSRAELERSQQRKPANLNAFELTLRGRQLWQRPNREALLEARSLFLRAADADSSYPPPSSLCRLHASNGIQQHVVGRIFPTGGAGAHAQPRGPGARA